MWEFSSDTESMRVFKCSGALHYLSAFLVISLLASIDIATAALIFQEDALRQSESKTKELDDEKNRLQKTNAAQQTQLDKYKKISEDRQSLNDSLETQVSALKKVWLLLFAMCTVFSFQPCSWYCFDFGVQLYCSKLLASVSTCSCMLCGGLLV